MIAPRSAGARGPATWRSAPRSAAFISPERPLLSDRLLPCERDVRAGERAGTAC